MHPLKTTGAATFDAAALLMPLVRFVSPTDPRWIATLRGMDRFGSNVTVNLRPILLKNSVRRRDRKI
jgi:hypothetical protein